MSIYFNVTEEDMNNLRKLAEQQKNQRALKIEIRMLKQTHDVKLTESLSPINKKLDKINETTKKLGDVIKESKLEIDNLKPLPNSSNFSISMRQMIGSLMNSRSSPILTQEDLGQANILGIPIQTSGDVRNKITYYNYDSTPDITKALSSTSYNGKTMKNEKDNLMM